MLFYSFHRASNTLILSICCYSCIFFTRSLLSGVMICYYAKNERVGSTYAQKFAVLSISIIVATNILH